MPEYQFTGDPQVGWLAPATSRAARALLNWEPIDLHRRVLSRRALLVPVRQIVLFEQYGEVIDRAHCGAMFVTLAEKVEFSVDEERPGVLRKKGAAAHLGEGRLIFGSPMKRLPKL